MEDSDTVSTESVDIDRVIDHVEDCIRRLEAAEEAAYLQFKAPGADEAARAALWTKHGIVERYPVEQLESLLASLATEQRDARWFKWLTWALFGEPTEGR